IISILLLSGLVNAESIDPYKKAEKLISDKKYTEASVILNSLIGKNKRDLKAYILIADMYMGMGGPENINMAQSYYYMVSVEDEKNIDSKMGLGVCAYALGHKEKARIIFEDIYKTYSNTYSKTNSKAKNINYYMGLLAFDRDQTETARNYFKKELEVKANNVDTLFMLGVTYEYNNKGERKTLGSKIEEAVKYYNETLSIDPLYAPALFNLSLDYSIKKEQDKAIEIAEKILKIKTAEGLYNTVYYNLACFYSLKKDMKRSMENLKKAIDHGFNDFDHMKKDEDLAYLRNKKEFKDLIKSNS
ncbi:MAG: tetratricopeptide repeat protein, partial [Proteobacteria bacterium]|nr:tetratricopeptide repeat protein [Pseudomonadota bacterium]